MGNEPCDDGNKNNDDGCSSTCTVENDFNCQLNLANPAGSVCFYKGKISIDLVYINKVDGLNQVQMLFKLTPNNISLINNMN
jgi:cysteine-rich repeat protein